MTQQIPAKLAIGLPVYNGDNFLEECLESILGQTFQDFELIVSDNGSTDCTESICLRFAARDSRIKYYRNERNIGAAPNFNRVFELSDSEYFKWIAHDDVHEPGFLEQCIRILERDPSVILAYTRAITIDYQGNRLREWGNSADLGSNISSVRFRAGLLPPKDPIPLPIFGVIRSAVLRKTPLQAGFAGCDLALLAELLLYGRFYEVSEALFLQREHEERAGHKLSSDPHKARDFWMGKQGNNPELPSWQNVSAFRHAVAQSPLRFRERLRCYREILVWMKRQRSDLINDLILAVGEMPVIGPTVQTIHRRYQGRKWQSDIRRLTEEIQSLVPERSTLIVVDEGNFAASVFPQRHPLPFLEHDGQYWGPPANDDAAIQAVEKMRERGADFLVVIWPAFWWLDFYRGWSGYLHTRHRCIMQNNRIIVFDLRQSS
jgi:glycosyltransferase involved in cell wall biosynthesis